MGSKPKGLLEAEQQIDPVLKSVLSKAGAEDYIAIFATKGVNMKQASFMTDKQLSELGVHNAYLRQRIITALEEEMCQGKLQQAPVSAPPAGDIAPSAPLQTEDLPSAPPLAPVETYQSNECVICLENKCNIIFLPCGHVCSCWICEAGLTECPLCRATIVQKVRLC